MVGLISYFVTMVVIVAAAQGQEVQKCQVDSLEEIDVDEGGRNLQLSYRLMF